MCMDGTVVGAYLLKPTGKSNRDAVFVLKGVVTKYTSILRV